MHVGARVRAKAQGFHTWYVSMSELQKKAVSKVAVYIVCHWLRGLFKLNYSDVPSLLVPTQWYMLI